MQKKEIKTSVCEKVDNQIHQSIRPTSFSQYIGQNKLKENMSVYIHSAKTRKEALDHILLYGPPGLGKTTLAGIIAKEMDAKIHIIAAPAIEKPGDIASILAKLNEFDILFIDEIHRLPKVVEETLYSAMEDYAIDIMIGEGPQGKSVHLSLPHFTLIGATTRAGMISAPLRDRFGIVHKFNYYSEDELAQIIIQTSNLLNIAISKKDALLLGSRSRGTPRIANRLIKRVRDFVEYDNTSSSATSQLIEKTLSALQITDYGLDENDMTLLKKIHVDFADGPVGVATLAAAVGEDIETIEEIYEPYMIQKGLLQKTPRGRVLSDAGIELVVRRGL